jgi:MFS family permease
MAVGPMTGLFLHQFSTFDVIFYTAVASGLIGFVFAMSIRVNQAFVPKAKEPIAFDRFFLFRGTKAGICLLLMGVAYGMLVIYIALYGRKLGLTSVMSFFFACMSAGMVSARLFSGKLVDKGKLRNVIVIGTAICVGAFLILASLNSMNEYSHNWVVVLFFLVSILMGLGYGMVFPAYNTLFVNLAPNNRRATASSTYMTSWDMGVGLGVVVGGRIADTNGGLALAYLVGGFAVTFSLVYFIRVAGPHFQQYKLR